MAIHRFGGAWTDEKLAALRGYLTQYRRIFTKNVRAGFFTTYYVDAFAGTGSREDSIEPIPSDLFAEDEAVEPEREQYKSGSARIALELEQPFDRYIFI